MPTLSVAAAATIVALPANAFAQQEARGEITGRVLNASTDRYLGNARIRVVGTNIETFTDSFGEYRLSNVPAGSVTVEVFYTGLPTKTTTVTVTPGSAVTSDFTLGGSGGTGSSTDEVLELSEFVVEAQRETDPSALAINEQRFSPNIKNVVSTDAYGAINQGNIGEFLKYVPGVTLEMKDGNNPSGIQIRGFSSNYTNVTLNGGQLASAALANTTNHTRQFVLEQANINNLSRIEVYKVPLPEHSANSLGGSVNLVSKSAFEYAKPQLRFRAYLSANSGEVTTQKTTGPGEEESYKILPSFDATYILPVNKKFGVVASFAQASQTYLLYSSVPAARMRDSGATMENPYFKTLSYRRSPNRTDRTSGSIKLDYKPWTNHVFELTLQADAFKQQQATRQINYDVGNGTPTSWGSTFTNGAATGGSANMGGSYQGRHGLTRAAGGKYTFKNSDWELDAAYLFSHSNNRVKDKGKGFWNTVSTTLPGVGSVTYTGIDVDDGRVDSAVVKNTTGGVINVADLNNYRITRVGSNEMDAEDTKNDLRLNARRQLRFLPFGAAVKTGASRISLEREMDFHITEYNYVGADGVANTADDGAGAYADPTAVGLSPGFGQPGMTWLSPWRVFDAFQEKPSWFARHDLNNSINRNAERSPLVQETITSGYLMADTQFFSNTLRLVGGVRYELTENEGYGPLTPTTGGTKIYRGFYNESDYDDFFPSVHGTYNITDSLIFRAAFAKTLGRPPIFNIVPNLQVVQDLTIPEGGRVTASNPNLEPWFSKNYDLSLEYYLPNSGVLAVGVFRKDIEKFFFSSSHSITAEEAEALNLGSETVGYRYTTLYNIQGTSRITGMEINIRQPLGFLGNWGERFELIGSFTKLDLDAPTRQVQGAFSDFVPKAVNAGFRYGFGRFSGNVLVNHRGKQQRSYISDLGRSGNSTSGPVVYGDEYVRSRNQVDADMNYRINSRLSLFFAVRNALNASNEQEKSGPGQPEWAQLTSYQKFGAQYSLGIQGTF